MSFHVIGYVKGSVYKGLADYLGPGDKAKALNVLREAAFKKTVAPDEVVGAIAFLEEEEQGAGGFLMIYQRLALCRPARMPVRN